MKKSYQYINRIFTIDFPELIHDQLFQFWRGYYDEITETTRPDFYVNSHVLNNEQAQHKVMEQGELTILQHRMPPSQSVRGYILPKGLLRYVYNLSTGGLYTLNYYTRSIDIANGNHEKLFDDAVFVTREILRLEVGVKDTAVSMHAAVVQSQSGKGVMLIGPKGSGKTSLLLHLIYNFGYAEVAPDRCHLINSPVRELLCYGVPTNHNVMASTLMNNAKSRHLLPEPLQSARLEDLIQKQEKWNFSSQQLGFDDRRLGRSRLDCIVTLGSTDTNLADMLAENCYTPYDPGFTNWHEWNHIESGIEVSRNTLDLVSALPKMHAHWKEDLDAWCRKIDLFARSQRL